MSLHEVTGCNDCPFYAADQEVMTATCTLARRGGPFGGPPLCTTASDQGFDYTPPDWCPLRKGTHVSETILVKKG